MAKMTWNSPGNKDRHLLIVLFSLTISVFVIMFLWKYYDSKMADMESRMYKNNIRHEAGLND
jgi:hypothetical protein